MNFLTMDLTPFTSKKIFVFSFKADVKHPDELVEVFKQGVSGDMVQIVDARNMVSEKFIRHAVLNALIFKSARWIDDASLRLLAFLACEKQIVDAIRKIGLKEGENRQLLLIVVSDSEKVVSEVNDVVSSMGFKSIEVEEAFKLSEEKLKNILEKYLIESAELESCIKEDLKEALTDLLVERMNLVKLKI